VKNNGMGGKCNTLWTEGFIEGFEKGGNLMERDHLEVIDVDGRIILKSVFKKYNGGL
jgi:hypothetical protein